MQGRQHEVPVVVAARSGHAAVASLEARARTLAERLGLAVVDDGGADHALALVVGESGLALRLAGGPLVTARTDLLAVPRGGGADALYRAVLSGSEAVLDATAGLGGDAFHLAARGVSVTMVERSPVVAALLEDALARARSGALGAAAQTASGRLDLIVADAVGVLADARRAVVLLDPMFPARQGSAATNKGLEALRIVTQRDEPDAAAMLDAARRSATRRVVVKRGARDAPLADVSPSGSLVGRSVRFDLYAPVHGQ